jgi:guanylate kinase
MSNDDFLLLILSSPSGAGKTTLKTRILTESHPEQGGREYHFIDRNRFERMAAAGEFAEWAEVHGNLYGTSLLEIDIAKKAHTGVVFDIDHQGARQIKAKMPDAVSVFILPPSMAELERRLRSRASDDEETVQRRLQAARSEIDHYAFFDYLVVNDDLDRAHEKLDAIVIAERAKRARVSGAAERLLAEGKV